MLAGKYFGTSGNELVAATQRRVQLLRIKFEVVEIWTCEFAQEMKLGGALARFEAEFQLGGCTIRQREYSESEMIEEIHRRQVHGTFSPATSLTLEGMIFFARANIHIVFAGFVVCSMRVPVALRSLAAFEDYPPIIARFFGGNGASVVDTCTMGKKGWVAHARSLVLPTGHPYFVQARGTSLPIYFTHIDRAVFPWGGRRRWRG